MKRFLLILLTALLLCSCTEQAEQQTGTTFFEDSTGVIVSLSQRPQRVAVLFSSYAELWQLAGGEISVTVGESVQRGFADEGTPLVDEGSGHSDINLEALLAQEPDFVIGTADYAGQVQAVEFCRRSGIPAALFSIETVDDYLNTLQIFTDITGQSDRYETYGSAVKEQVDTLIKTVSDSNPTAPKKILFIRAGSSAKSTKAKGTEDHFACGMLSQLACVNIADSAPILLDGLSVEEVITAAPDHIFISTMGEEAAAVSYLKGVFDEDGWRDLPAVRNGQYTILPKELFHYKPNHRFPEAYEYLIHELYPDLIP